MFGEGGVERSTVFMAERFCISESRIALALRRNDVLREGSGSVGILWRMRRDRASTRSLN